MANDHMNQEAFDAMLRGDGLFWDCEVKASDRVFRANRYQLSRCKKFRDFFKDMESNLIHSPAVRSFADDCCSPVLDLSEFSGLAVLEMLRWLYLGNTKELTAKTDIKTYVVEEVFVLACNWEIPLLMEKCLNAVESCTIVVTDENFIQLTFMAMIVDEQGQGLNFGYVNIHGVTSFYKRWLNVFVENFNRSAKNVVEKLKAEGVHILNGLILLKASEDNIQLPSNNVDSSNTNEQFKISAMCDEKFFSEVSSSVSICSSSSVSKILDFKIFCIDSPEDRPILCHKMALARVPRWARMFENESEESQRGFANVEICVAAMLEVLRYMYMGLNEDLTRVLPALLHLPERYMAEDVLQVSHEYGVDELTQRCFKSLLMCEVNNENVIRLLQLAYLYDSAALKEKFLRYFVQNRIELLHPEKDCEDWKRVLEDANLHVAIAIVDTVLPKDRSSSDRELESSSDSSIDSYKVLPLSPDEADAGGAGGFGGGAGGFGGGAGGFGGGAGGFGGGGGGFGGGGGGFGGGGGGFGGGAGGFGGGGGGFGGGAGGFGGEEGPRDGRSHIVALGGIGRGRSRRRGSTLRLGGVGRGRPIRPGFGQAQVQEQENRQVPAWVYEWFSADGVHGS